MVTLSPRTSKTPEPRDATPAVRARRVQFVHETASAGDRRRFTQPHRASAVEEDVAIESVAAGDDPREPIDHVFLVCIPPGSSPQPREWAKALVAHSERADAKRAITLEHGSEVLDWRPGLAVLQCREESRGDVLGAVVDFAFYEGQLRLLEQSVEAAEIRAESDVALAHRIRRRDRRHWERLTACAEQCSRMRLTFARLEPQLLAASPALSPTARSWMTRLLQKSDAESRLESLSDRLEALEELYEGATQRIAEYRWYVGGHALEIGILVLLLVECLMMGGDIWARNRDRSPFHVSHPTADVTAD